MTIPPVKPLLDKFRIHDGPDFDAGTNDLDEIKRMGVLGLNRPDDEFRWIAPRNLAQRTTGTRAEYQEVYYHPSSTERRRIVRVASNGNVDLVLCVKKMK